MKLYSGDAHALVPSGLVNERNGMSLSEFKNENKRNIFWYAGFSVSALI